MLVCLFGQQCAFAPCHCCWSCSLFVFECSMWHAGGARCLCVCLGSSVHLHNLIITGHAHCLCLSQCLNVNEQDARIHITWQAHVNLQTFRVSWFVLPIVYFIGIRNTVYNYRCSAACFFVICLLHCISTILYINQFVQSTINILRYPAQWLIAAAQLFVFCQCLLRI